MNYKKVIELANEILETNKDKLEKLTYIDIRSEEDSFISYRDRYIKIVKAKNGHALRVDIYAPLTKTYNPIIFVDDSNRCYRIHGEACYFITYCEKLLSKKYSTKNERIIAVVESCFKKRKEKINEE